MALDTPHAAPLERYKELYTQGLASLYVPVAHEIFEAHRAQNPCPDLDNSLFTDTLTLVEAMQQQHLRLPENIEALQRELDHTATLIFHTSGGAPEAHIKNIKRLLAQTFSPDSTAVAATAAKFVKICEDAKHEAKHPTKKEQSGGAFAKRAVTRQTDGNIWLPL